MSNKVLQISLDTNSIPDIALLSDEFIGKLDGNPLFTESKTRLIFLKQGSGESLVSSSEVFRHVKPLTECEISELLSLADGGFL